MELAARGAGMELIDRRRRAVAALQTELAAWYPRWPGRATGQIATAARSVRPRQGGPVAALERLRAQELRRGQRWRARTR